GVENAEDVMAKFKRALEGERKQAPPLVAPGENPARGSNGLSQEPEAYAGTYVHPTLGQLQISVKDGDLLLNLGDIHPGLVSDGPDKFIAAMRGSAIKAGSFEIAPDGKVVSITIRFDDDDEAKFSRR